MIPEAAYLRLVALTKPASELVAVHDAVRTQLTALSLEASTSYGEVTASDRNSVPVNYGSIIDWVESIVLPSSISNPDAYAEDATEDEIEAYGIALDKAKQLRTAATLNCDRLQRFAATMGITSAAAADASASLMPTEVVSGGLALAEGATATIAAEQLQYTHETAAAADIAYTITTATANGKVALAAAPTVSITEFTQAQIDADAVVYVHDGTDTPVDSFAFSVTDGDGHTITGQAFDIEITLDGTPD